MNIKDISIGPIRHDTLTAKQIADITYIHTIMQEVDASTLEQTITDFKRDVHPDEEIAVWMNMATAYDKFVTPQTNNMSLESKQEVYNIILLRSMMPAEQVIAEAELKHLTEKELKTILSYYEAKPSPIQVYKK